MNKKSFRNTFSIYVSNIRALCRIILILNLNTPFNTNIEQLQEKNNENI